MNKRDYITACDGLEPSPQLRARVTALGCKRSVGRAYRTARVLARAACLALFVAGAAVFFFSGAPGRILRTLLPDPIPSPIATPAPTAVPTPAPPPSLPAAGWSVPVLPLSVPSGERSGALSVTREVTFDLCALSGPDAAHSPTAAVTDRYVLQNRSDEPWSGQLCYPWVGTLASQEEGRPTVTQGGTAGVLAHFDGQVGTVVGSTVVLEGPDGQPVFGALPDYAACRALFTARGPFSRSYLLRSVGHEELTIRDLSVNVYTVADVRIAPSAPFRDPERAAVGVTFTLSDPTAQVFTYGFDGRSLRESDGAWILSFSSAEAPALHRILVMGGELREVAVSGYQDSSCTQAVQGVSAQVTSRQWWFADATADLYERYDQGLSRPVDTVQLYYAASSLIWHACRTQVMVDDLYSPGPDQPPVSIDPQLCRDGWVPLEEVFSAALRHQRVLYRTCYVSIPPGETLTLEAAFPYRPAAPTPEHPSLFSFDLAPTLGSTLGLDSLTLTAALPPEVHIAWQNTALVSAPGTTSTCTLDPAAEHYAFALEWLQP